MSDFDHLVPPRENQFVSVGHVCGLLQILPGQLRVLMEDTDVKFSLVLDGCGYLSVDDAESLARKCKEVREEISDAVAKCEKAPLN